MFKLESYITPIILNHVAKYVKNIRPEDSQVSLWEGEVAFQNLDLRLDVLEEELNLPFEILSGHIHELSILVPWMKIASEPIKITINTIEFVLKLRDHKSDTQTPQAEKKRPSKEDENGGAQQSLMPGIVNKIINNIVINCHNIILKYVEEDIVVSMNIQFLSFTSADEFWESAFIDIHPIRVFMRKLVKVSDLTICLDKRNAAGQIDVCQEPFLYRCSLEIRIIRKYNANVPQLGSVTRVSVFTKLMEMNVSSLQFPMAMRVFDLIMALKSGKLHTKAPAELEDEDAELLEGYTGGRSSFVRWMWNLLPSFDFTDIDEENKLHEDDTGVLSDFAFYIENLNFTLKHAEFITDSIVGATKKIRYSPIVKVMLSGLYTEMLIIADKNWCNMKGGCSSISVEPLGTYKDEDSDKTILLTTAPFKNRTFLDRGLFDERAAESDWILTNFDEYSVRVTEEYLLYRTPVIAFDLMEYKEHRDPEKSVTEEDDRKRVTYRILANNITFRFSPSYTRIVTTVQELIDTYDYPHYYETEVHGGSPKLHPPLLDDFDSLMAAIPLKVYKFNLTHINIELHARGKPVSTKPARKSASKKCLPHFEVAVDKVEGQWTTPLNPNKLVHTTCQLPDKPQELLDACYENGHVEFKNVSLSLVQVSGTSVLCHIPQGTVNFGDLLQPTLWKNEEVPQHKLDISLESVVLEFSKYELTMALRLNTLIREYDGKNSKQLLHQASTRDHNSVKIRTVFTRLNVDTKRYISTKMFRGSLKSIQSHTMLSEVPPKVTIPLFVTMTANQGDKWLEWYLQIPNQSTQEQCPKCVLALWMKEYALHIDENFVEFLKYTETELPTPPKVEPSAEVTNTTQRPQLVKQTSKKSLTSERQARRTCYPEETIHVSSERDEKVNVSKHQEKDLQEQTNLNNILLPYIKCLMVKVLVAKGQLRISPGSIGKHPSNDNYTLVKLPYLIFNSAGAENINRVNVQNEFQSQVSKSIKDTFPWNCCICDFSIENVESTNTLVLVHPIQTAITIALTHKIETVNKGKEEPLLPQVSVISDEIEADKTKHSQLSAPPMSNVASTSPVEALRKAGGSVSANARSQTSEENEQKSKGVEKKKKYLQDTVENIFASQKKTETKDVVSVSLHIDTSPIALKLDSKRAEQLHNQLELILKILSLFPVSSARDPDQQRENIQIITANEDNDSIKQFLEIDTNSESSLMTAGGTVNKFVISVFLQWTITKFTVEFAASDAQSCKLVFDFEDLISSVDKREDFTKITTKVGSLSARFYELNSAKEFALSERFRIKMQASSTQSPLFNMIITTVGVKNFFNKIGAKRKDCDMRRAITEIIVKMEALELIVDMDELAKIAPTILRLVSFEPCDESLRGESDSCYCPSTVNEIPLIHMESKGFTLYIPLETKNTWCSVAILKIGGIKVTPSLENPLQRSPVRPDVYQKAAQMGILSTPGSIIEDRQYELSLHNVSAASGNWDEVLAHMRDHVDNFHNTNPAFEWNNQSRKTSLKLRKIFSNFMFVISYAPCITCNNVLICGTAIEFNCSNDLDASLTTDQITLFSSVLYKMLNIDSAEGSRERARCDNKFKKSSSSPATLPAEKSNGTKMTASGSIYSVCSKVSQTSDAQHLCEETSEFPLTDSGFSSSKMSFSRKALESSTELQRYPRQIPSTISFVAGTFVINLYKYKRTILGVPQGDEVSVVETLTPLMSIDFSQPSFLISQSIYEVSKRFSVFNFSVNLFHTPDFIEDDELEEKEQVEPNILFETKRGEVGSSGIPPALVVVKAHQSKTKQVDIDISFSKPGVVRLTEKSLLTLTKNLISYYGALLENPCLHLCAEVPILKQTKLQLMRNILFSADRFNLRVEMLKLKYTEMDQYNLKISIVDLRLAVKFSNRPEKMNAKASVGGICVQNGRDVVVHPIGFKCNLDTVQESWNRLPLITASIKFNVIRCTVGVEIVTSLLQALKSFYSDLENTYNLWEEFMQSRSGDSHEINRNRLQTIYLPEPKQWRRARQKEEFYQDDLRAGAFQFVEMLSDSFLPMPYQIQIIKKNYGIICWRYPQPRMMSKIHIFPVPMAVPNPIRIKCRMEYFSDAHESFLHYCDFWLSETVSKVIDLPERVVTAQIWRVVILQSLVSVDRECFDTSEEDEELRSIVSLSIDDVLNGANRETDFILHPKVLVGCMRIDTIFRVAAIPKAQVLLNVSEIQVDLQNYQSMTSRLPRALKKFKLSENYKPFNQTFLSIRIQNASVHASFLTSSDYSIHSEVTLLVKCLDYGYLNKIFLIEPTNMTGYFKVVNGGVESSIVADRLCINIGPSVLHSLICAKQNWEGYLKDEAERKTYIVTKFIVVNRTLSNIAFGQTGTGERILLHSRECCKYSFQSEYFEQHLSFYIQIGKVEHASESIPIVLDFPPNSNNIYTHARVKNKILIVKIRRLSATQYYILIKGQIELISMVPDVFLLDFYENERKINEKEIRVEKKDRASYVQGITSGSEISIRLRMFGDQGKGQTGNIPLKSNKNYPWLVKVPVVGPEKFVSYWVRIVRECINEENITTCTPERILITIWSIFEMRSLMTCHMTGNESTTKQIFELAPEGLVHPLKVPATHQTDHLITLSNDFNSTLPDFNLTLKAVDWNKFFWYNENVWTIEHALNELAKPERLKWPINDEEELRIRRTHPDDNDTTVLYKCFPSREFSCSIRLEVAPWGTFINTTAEKILVHSKEAAKSTEVAPNSIAMIPQMKSEFTIEISNGLSLISSLPIVFDKSVNTARRKCYRVNENEATDIVILNHGYVYKLRLQFVVENERNIFVLKPKYVIANMSKYSLFVFPFALDHKETVSKKDIIRLSEGGLVAMPTATTNEYSVGICVDGFHDMKKGKAARTTDSAFVFFLSICVEKKSEISIPLTLMHPFNRKCFSVQYDERSIPFTASLLEKNGQFFVNIFEDTSPMVKINNQTDLTLIVGQTYSPENSKVSDVIPEYDGKHFEWQQLLMARSELYYTPSMSYANFPDVEISICNLSIALYNENQSNKNVKWSNAIPMDISWEKFLHVPAHGDVKIIVCNKHHVIRLSIVYIAQQLEFSVKDLRSRLLTPQASNSPENFDSEQQPDDATEILNNEPLQRVKPAASSKCIHQLVEPGATMNPVFKLRFSVEEIVVKIFVDCKTADYMKKEIFALYVDNFLLKFDNNKRVLNVHMSNLQIDNQLFSSGNYDFPVVLCSQELYKRTLTAEELCINAGRGSEPDPMVDVSVTFYDDEFKIRSVGCRVSPVRAYIEDTYLNDLLDYLVECAPSNVVVTPSDEKYYVRLEPGEYLIPRDIAAQALCISEPLKMQYFRIDAMDVMLSVHTCVRLYIALDHSPLQFSTYERQDILTLPLRFGHTLGMHYLSGALFGAGWVVGSLEMLGSPSGLARSFSVGLKDFVSMPVQGLLRGPWGFVVGITQGSASLLRNVTAGTVNSVTKLAASVSRNLDRLTLDEEHIQRTEALRRCRPQGFAEGFTQGITGLGISILGAVGGIARHTLEARSATEVMAGVGKGIVGALTKPISGAAELVALTGQGVLHTVGFNAMPQQRSLSVPRNIAAHASEHRIWLLILKLLPSVMENDQILFYHEVTLLVNDKLSPGSILLSSSIFALFEMGNHRFSFMHPVKRIEVTIDPNDKTLVHMAIKKQPNENEEDSFYTNQRIMRFLETSSVHIGMNMGSESLDHLLKKDFKDSSDTASFYINENLGQYLIQYLRIVNLNHF